MATTPRVGTVFAGYRVERVLGRGGMSVVYLAEHPRLKSAVALKLLSPALAEDDLFRERLLRESRLAASLSHPNVIPVFDTGEEDGVLFVSMRFVDGPDLRALLRESGPLPLEKTTAVLTQVAAALDAAAARGLVHRDVKPANVLLEGDHVYVADFGLTKHADARSGATASGLVGTIDYMAPEQIEGRQVDARADVYSLGCVLYECLTGRPPFQADNDVAVIWSHMRDDPPRPTDADRSLPRSLDAVVEKALAKDPRDRYATAGELAEDLRAAAAASGRRRATPLVSLRRLRRRPRARARRRWVVPALAGVVVGAGVAAAVAALAFNDGGGTSPPRRAALPAADADLLRLVPAPVRATCVRAEPPTPDFDASLSCRPRDGAVTSVRYSRALSGSRMRAQLISRAWEVGVAAPGERVSPRGRCEDTTAAVRDWGEAAPGARVELTRRVGAPARGRLLCYTSPNGWAGVEWTDTRYDVYSVAYGRSRDGLYRWWSNHGGPTAPA